MFELPKLLVTGADGQLGYELVASAREEGFDVAAYNHDELDITDAAAVAQCLQQERPTYLVNCAGQLIPSVEQDDVDFTVNSVGPAVLAQACQSVGVVLVQLSCADVFDGEAIAPYAENQDLAGVSEYGVSLIAGEQAVQQHLQRYLILRTGWVFSGRGPCPVRYLLEQARAHAQVPVADGLIGCPTAANDVARVILALVKQLDCDIDNCWGTYHYAASEPVSWFGFCEAVIAAARQYENLALDELVVVPQLQLNRYARPAQSVLDCHHILRTFGVHQRSWRTGLMQAVRTFYTPAET